MLLHKLVMKVALLYMKLWKTSIKSRRVKFQRTRRKSPTVTTTLYYRRATFLLQMWTGQHTFAGTTPVFFQSGFREWLPGVPLKQTEIAWDDIRNHSSVRLQQYRHLYRCIGFHEQRKHLRKVPLQQKAWKTLHFAIRSTARVQPQVLFEHIWCWNC